jgi:hypothetical protein
MWSILKQVRELVESYREDTEAAKEELEVGRLDRLRRRASSLPVSESTSGKLVGRVRLEA